MLTSPTLMANIAKLLQNPEMLKALLGAGLVASEAVKGGKKNEGARAGLMIGNVLLDMFDEDGPFKNPLQGTIFSNASEGVEGIANRTQKNFNGFFDMRIDGSPTDSDYWKDQAYRHNKFFG